MYCDLKLALMYAMLDFLQGICLKCQFLIDDSFDGKQTDQLQNLVRAFTGLRNEAYIRKIARKRKKIFTFFNTYDIVLDWGFNLTHRSKKQKIKNIVLHDKHRFNVV